MMQSAGGAQAIGENHAQSGVAHTHSHGHGHAGDFGATHSGDASRRAGDANGGVAAAAGSSGNAEAAWGALGIPASAGTAVHGGGFQGATAAPYSRRGDISRSGRSVCGWIVELVRRASEDSDARLVLAFISVSVVFLSGELVYGMSVNSLGLVSDAFHMVFHCLAMGTSLVAMLLARRSPTFEFSYGFDRHEVLAAFTNAMFLAFVCFFLWVQALHRMMYPVDIEAEQLTLIGIVGLMIDVGGILAFRRVETRRSRGRARGSIMQRVSAASLVGGAHTTNMGAIYLHLLADAASSLGVVVSSILVRGNGWMVADPLLSFCIASGTLYVVIPLFRATGRILLQTTPVELAPALARCKREVATIDGVLEANEEHFWSQSPGVVVGSICVRVRADASEQATIKTVQRIFAPHIAHMTVQVEKDPPLDWMLPNASSAVQ